MLTKEHANSIEYVLTVVDHLAPRVGGADNRALAREAVTEIRRNACPLCSHEWRRHDPEDGRCDAPSEFHAGACECGRDINFMRTRIAEQSSAALRSP